MSSTKTRRLDLRLTEEQDALIRRAAEQDARSISDFVLSAATLDLISNLNRYLKS